MVFSSIRLKGMCRWMGLHFQEFLERGHSFSGFWGKKFLVSRDLRLSYQK